MPLTRRQLLAGGALAILAGGAGTIGLVEAGILPGQVALDHALGRCNADAGVPRIASGLVERGTFTSQRRRRAVGFAIGWPPGAAKGDALPVVLVLHGRGSGAAMCFDRLHLDAFLAAHVAGGDRRFALASPEGHERYWHPRADGDDPHAMVTQEFLPMLRDRGLQTERMGVLGWSMGGYGALLWARLSGDGKLPTGVHVSAAVAESPALFRSFRDTTTGSFDDAADFSEWGDLLARPGVDPTTALRIDCGSRDPFRAVTEDYRAAVQPVPAGGISGGCHTNGYWRSRAADQIAFLGRHIGR